MKTYFVYITIDHKNKKLYLGRRYGELNVAIDRYYGSSAAIKNILRSRKPHMLTRFILETYIDRSSHIFGERFWGNELNVVEDNRFYNRTSCGHGGFEHLKHQKGNLHPRHNVKLSDETRLKISNAHKGVKRWSDEDRRRMSEKRSGTNHPMYGRKHSEESKAKNREANLGRVSPTKGKKIPEKQRLRKCKTFEFISPDGEVFISQDRSTFCVEHDLSYTNMAYSAYQGGRSLSGGRNKGWSCRLI